MVKKSRSGFTLAEVLTTLMVIGVVAAMTIPTLLNSTNEQQLRVAYKKGMSILSQGIQLMVAKEEECKVTNSHELADCMQKVISGTLYEISSEDKLVLPTTTGKGNVIVTNDGLSYAFYYKKGGTGEGDAYTPSNAETYKRSLDDICGTASEKFKSDVKDWSGENSNCIVVVDMNGPAKGTHGYGQKEDAQVAGKDCSGITGLIGSDQMPLLLTGGGVRPLYVKGKDTFNNGYKWVYGENAGEPTTTVTENKKGEDEDETK